MTTAKKILTLALCLTCLTAGMTGCAKDKSSSDTKIAKSTSSQSESNDSEKIKELNDKLEMRERRGHPQTHRSGRESSLRRA